ncbi:MULTISPECIES: S1 family peptidase [unclassified Sphingomonas]|uniref:S1 family peptidase n=1 Tax=unclassified Sphingomonas TaxID=196159 RepID=UPI001F1BC084|nr:MULTISPECIES: S1 family peptidase [unclassified Sphingomonas]
MLSLLALAVAGPAAAQVWPVQREAEALAVDAAEVARTEGGTAEAALAELRAQGASVALTEWIEGAYRDRLAGLSLDTGGDVSVLLTGRKPVADMMAQAGEATVVVRFRTGAKATRDQLLAAIREHQAAIRAMLARPPAMGIDARRGELVIMIGGADAAGDREQLRKRIERLTDVPVRLAPADRPDGLLAGTAALDAPPSPLVGPVVPGGSQVMGPDPVNGRRYICTTGFAVSDGERTAIVTAAHCPDTLEHIATDGSRIPLPFVGQWGWGFQDVQVNLSPLADRAVFFADTARTQVRQVEHQRGRAATRVGDLVCHRGERSGYSCARVLMTDFAPSGDLCGGACLPMWVAVAGPSCRGGDSGGPIFIGTTAIGLLKGSSYRGDRSCGFYYYMPIDYLPEGWRLLTVPRP